MMLSFKEFCKINENEANDVERACKDNTSSSLGCKAYRNALHILSTAHNKIIKELGAEANNQLDISLLYAPKHMGATSLTLYLWIKGRLTPKTTHYHLRGNVLFMNGIWNYRQYVESNTPETIATIKKLIQNVDTKNITTILKNSWEEIAQDPKIGLLNNFGNFND